MRMRMRELDGAGREVFFCPFPVEAVICGQ